MSLLLRSLQGDPPPPAATRQLCNLTAVSSALAKELRQGADSTFKHLLLLKVLLQALRGGSSSTPPKYRHGRRTPSTFQKRGGLSSEHASRDRRPRAQPPASPARGRSTAWTGRGKAQAGGASFNRELADSSEGGLDTRGMRWAPGLPSRAAAGCRGSHCGPLLARSK